MRAGLNGVFWEPGVVTSIILPELLETSGIRLASYQCIQIGKMRYRQKILCLSAIPLQSGGQGSDLCRTPGSDPSWVCPMRPTLR